jgi:hypothetical protein
MTKSIKVNEWSNTMKTNKTMLIAGFAATLTLAALNGAAMIELNDSWSEASLNGWTGDTYGVTLSNPGGYLNIGFVRQSFPESVAARCRKAIDVDGTVTNISFRLRADDYVPSAVRATFETVTGRTWALNLGGVTVGEWVEFSVPVDFDAGWSFGPCSTRGAFDADRMEIAAVGLYVRRNGSCDAQNVRVDDFEVLGESGGPAGGDLDADGMPNDWEARYGLDMNDAADADEDADGDGMSNLAEYMAGTNPTDDDSVLRIAAMTSGTETIGLTCVAGPNVRQELQWTDSLLNPWQTVATFTPDTEISQVEVDAPETAGFYRLRVAAN